MSQSNVHHYYSKPFQTFYRWLEENYKSSGNQGDAPFLPYDLLSDHLESNECEALKTLLGAFNQGRAVPISAKEVVSAYSKIFCILIWVGKIESLPVFMGCDDLNDQHLPFKFHDRPSQFPIDPTAPRFFEEFCQAQWRFCPPTFDANCNRRLEKEYVLPFTKKKQIAKGASATISTIEIYPLYNALPLLANATNGSATIFALKTYQGRDAEKSWSNEVQTFQKLRDVGSSPNVIGFYTAFKHGSTWHCILEYADRGSLEQYLRLNMPPKDKINIARLWKRVLGLIRGLKDLQNGHEVIYHQDVKPANILVLSDSDNSSPYASIFKIADLGTSHSKRIVATDQDHSDPDAQGTRTYGAPECYRSDSTLGQGNLRVTEAVDIFSLGCILSEVAVWMSGGYEYLMQYRQARRKAIDQIPDFHDGDCFHNGINMLPIVGEWHKEVQSRFNFSDDTFTPILIPLIEEMLLDAQHRGDAKTLCTKTHTIYTEALQDLCRRSPDQVIPDDILPRSLRAQSQRMDPPVRPFDNDQPLRSTNFTPPSIPTNSTVSNSESASNQLQHESLVQSQLTSISGSRRTLRGMHAFEPGPRLGRHSHVTSAPLEVQASIFENYDTGARRYSEQPLHQTRPRITRDGPQISSMIDPAPGSALFVRSSIPSFHNSGHEVITNGNAFGPNTMNHSYESEPYSPLTGAVTPPVRPSTCCPVVFPAIHASTHSPVNSRNQHSVVANMSRNEAMLWRDQKKSTSRWSRCPGPVLRDQWVLKFLEDRDSVIIIDDSESMRKHHWEDMIELLGIIAYMIKSFDKDGLDLYFAQSNAKHNEETSSKLVSIVEKRKREEDLGYTDMSVRLEQILGEYARKIQRQSSQNIVTRGLNVYIFTDAIWTPLCDIVPAIDKMVEGLVAHKLPEKQVGLQFISFGDDAECLKRLMLVDNYLVLKPKLPHDIVDTTPSTGNLYKMIRGAIDRNFDYASEEASSSATNSSYLPR
ncbi:hypothetical protein B0J14DRAFT_85731 [Halenospora varia]|nr:hypothetical protein B0J14DRAFT_85731 [Halenospora varia]